MSDPHRKTDTFIIGTVWYLSLSMVVAKDVFGNSTAGIVQVRRSRNVFEGHQRSCLPLLRPSLLPRHVAATRPCSPAFISPLSYFRLSESSSLCRLALITTIVVFLSIRGCQ